MNIDKKQIIKKFQNNPERYWQVELFKQKGFIRKKCSNCGKFFWTLDANREVCDDQPCRNYEFIGNPPTNKKLSYNETWKTVEKFFVRKGHTSIRRYPVVCRWYPLFFTIASIIDFYRIENGNVTFEFPANPLIVPQFCLRFNDISNVGVTGKHSTVFCMIGQHSLYDGKQGYWKDRCIELDFEFLTKELGIKPEEIVFIEDMWIGPGAFGTSLEYFSRGLELGNAVFTEFTGTPNNYKEMKEKVIDMGAGLERFAWITQGTPTHYDVTFEPVLRYMIRELGLKIDFDFFSRYSKISGVLNIGEVRNIEKVRKKVAQQLGVSVDVLNQKLKSMEALYAIADHTMALTFAISDGALPSNVGGGYNLRVISRRVFSFLDENKWLLDLVKVCELHARHLREFSPELMEHIDEINTILDIERKRFTNTKLRTKKIVESLVEKGEVIDENKLLQLYDSEGITPELVKEYLPDLKIPEDFYTKITEKHMKEEEKTERPMFDLTGLPPTKLLFYEDPRKYEFKAKVIKVIENQWIVLDETYFYPESGGQKADMGFIDGNPVIDVQKIGNVVIHKIIGNVKEGKEVECRINTFRREVLMRHHTATHIINAAARELLGEHVWQHSTEKTPEKARLDITHYDNLTEQQVEEIEKKANEIVLKNLRVKKEVLLRQEAEKRYGFRIYQGGAVPSKMLRIVSIGNIDHEACGGIHVDNTKEVGFITILKTKRIQDGIVRLEYCSGDVAEKYLKEKEKFLKETGQILKVKEDDIPKSVEELFNKWKETRKELKKLRRGLK